MADHELLLGLAADIISAHVSNHTVPADRLPTLIQQVFNMLPAMRICSKSVGLNFHTL